MGTEKPENFPAPTYLLNLGWQGWLVLLVIQGLGYLAMVTWAGFNPVSWLLGVFMGFLMIVAVDLMTWLHGK